MAGCEDMQMHRRHEGWMDRFRGATGLTGGARAGNELNVWFGGPRRGTEAGGEAIT